MYSGAHIEHKKIMDYYLIEFFHSRKVGTLNFNIALRLQNFLFK